MTQHVSKKRVLIAGGAGFLGSHLAEKLLDERAHVICLDNFSTGCETNLAHLVNNPSFQVINHDICLPLNIDVDEIYNLACPASPQHYQSDPIHTIKTNIYGSINLLDLAKRCKATIFQASTSEVYGDPEIHPQKESYFGNVNSIGPRACYDEGKRCAETLFFDYSRQHDVNIKVVRIFNTYGPRMHPKDGRVVSNFIVQALSGHDITIYGSGGQTRSFCYVDDLIEGFILMMNSPCSFKGPINLGSPAEFTILELAEKVISMSRSRSKLVFKPLPIDDPRKRRPDISLSIGELGWRPKIDIDEGLQKTIDYFKKILNI